MDPRIGASCAHDRDARATGEPGEGRLDLPLDRASRPWAGLGLPALEVGPVVGEGDAIQQRQRAMSAREPGFSGFDPAAQSGHASVE